MTNRLSCFLVLALACSSVACGTDDVGDSDSGTDANTDAPIDSSVSPNTDGSPPDATRATDTGMLDADGDGVADDVDCDPGDPVVGQTGSRSCSSACGDGTEPCVEGQWLACDASTECLCATPGMMRVSACERCGTQSELCGEDGTWEVASACLGQGTCEPAAVESRDTEFCGVEQRLCDDECAWSEWQTSTPDGECRRGTRYAVPLCVPYREAHCGEDCNWIVTPDCPSR